jgi:hypothetical protein
VIETVASILIAEAFTQKMAEACSIARSAYFYMDPFIVKTEPAGSKQIW